ncbi:MAG TPA: NAD-dependent epimerase/dehydratase family protein [Solirubrobacterales bacterium]|nr:NAD-dependent epimerase/dehydratase family protein [Solirubrobacterales bacterium]
MQGRKILVIGCGFIGTNVVAELVAAHRAPTVLTRSRPRAAVAEAIAGAEVHVGDATDAAALSGALEGVGHVVFSAGGLLPAASENNPELDARLTLGPVRAVLEALAARPGVALTYLSSGGTVYGEPASVPVSEEAPTEAFGAYGQLHLAAEAAVLEHGERYQTPVRILRCSTVYGPHQTPDRGQGVVVTFLHRIKSGIPVEIFGDGGTERDYIYVGDVARVIVDLLDKRGGPTVLNLGAGEGTTLSEVLALSEAEVGIPAVVVRHPQRGFEVRRIVLDISRLQGLIGFQPMPLRDGIARTHKWLASGVPEHV